MTIKSIFGLAATGFLLCACQSNTFQINGYARSFAEGDTICLLNESEQPIAISTDDRAEQRTRHLANIWYQTQ